MDATDGITPENGEAGGQPQLSVAGAAWGNTANTLVLIGNGRYYVELAEAEVTEDDRTVIETRYKSANTAEALGSMIQILETTNTEVLAAVEAASPQQDLALVTSAVIEGTTVSGSYAVTFIDDGISWIIQPDAVNGMEVILDFNVGLGRILSSVQLNGKFDKANPPNPNRWTDVLLASAKVP